MEMEIARLANVSWLHIPDRQVLAMRTASLSCNSASRFSAEVQEPVPMLDWPSTLFDDEVLVH